MAIEPDCQTEGLYQSRPHSQVEKLLHVPSVACVACCVGLRTDSGVVNLPPSVGIHAQLPTDAWHVVHARRIYRPPLGLILEASLYCSSRMPHKGVLNTVVVANRCQLPLLSLHINMATCWGTFEPMYRYLRHVYLPVRCNIWSTVASGGQRLGSLAAAVLRP